MLMTASCVQYGDICTAASEMRGSIIPGRLSDTVYFNNKS